MTEPRKEAAADAGGNLAGPERDTGSTPYHTSQGAPTDAAHQAAGDGTQTGSVPAGLTTAEMAERARDAGRDDAGSE